MAPGNGAAVASTAAVALRGLDIAVEEVGLVPIFYFWSLRIQTVQVTGGVEVTSYGNA